MNTPTPEMHENSNFSMPIGSLEKRLKDAAPSAAARLSAPAPAAVAASPAPDVDLAAYIAVITTRLMGDGYEP